MDYKQISHFLDTPPRQKIKLGLGRVRRVLDQLGRPQDRYPSIIIGGTNGKGSVVAMLASILAEAGYKVGWYTSPHILSYQERFRIGRRLIPAKDFIRIFNEISGHDSPDTSAEIQAGRILRDLTAFEIMTVMAFRWFDEKKVDIVLLEVGLGGRLDATNVVKPVLSVITNVEHDHHEYLGNTLTKIAREKAGIIKDGVPVITASKQPAALAVIKKTARQRKAPLIVVRFNSQKAKVYKTSLAGSFQKENQALAVAALAVLRNKGWRIPEKAVRTGFKKVRWPGRLEIVKRQPLMIFDVAHNPAAATALRESLKSLWPDRRWIFILGILRRKDAAGIIEALAPIAAKFYFVPLDGPAYSTDELLKLAEPYGRPAEKCLSVTEAFKKSRSKAKMMLKNNAKAAVCLAGSFLTVEAGKKAIRSRSGRRLR